MSDTERQFLGHERLTLQNFTAFKDCTLEFVPGINVFVGENGTGKTHALKALYAAHLSLASSQHKNEVALRSINDVFQINSFAEMVRFGTRPPTAFINGESHGMAWRYEVTDQSISGRVRHTSDRLERPVFIPAIDMMGNTAGRDYQ